MKKLFGIFLFACILISSLSVTGYAEKFSESVRTDTLLLVDSNTDDILYSQNAGKVRSMGSVTKVMTYIVTAEAVSDLQNTKTVIDSSIYADLDPDASIARLSRHDGEEMSILDLLYGLMLPSGCDAAVVLADFVGGDVDSFVGMMNKKAAELGCTDTRYADPHGLSDENQTTALDTYKIYKYALSLPRFREITAASYHYYENETVRPVYQTNYLIDTTENGIYYYPYCTGGKTGYITSAGKCLVSTAKKGDRELVCVALGGEYQSDSGYINYAMIDTRKLYEWGFDNYTENVYVDIPAMYLSVQLGDTKNISFTVDTGETGFSDALRWKSSDESIAAVDGNGTVTALRTGMVKITAETVTGNKDEIYVSCGFYNGMNVTSRNGDCADGTAKPVNWAAVKGSGIDFAVIRSGWSYAVDAAFTQNVNGAVENGVDFGISFASYADSTAEAAKDADYVLSLIEAAGCADKMKLPVVYDLVTYSAYASRSGETVAEYVNIFSDKMEENGYDVIIYADSTTLAHLDEADSFDRTAAVWEASYPWIVEYDKVMTYNDGEIPLMWEYKTDGYVEGAIRDNTYHTYQSLLYMASTYENLFGMTADGSADKKSIVSLTWEKNEDSVTDTEGYRIYRQAEGGERVLLDTVSAETTSYTDTTASPRTSYKYTIVPVFTDFLDSGYECEISAAEVSIKTPAKCFVVRAFDAVCGFFAKLFAKIAGFFMSICK